MSDCTHDCSTCGESCGERKEVSVFEKKPLRPSCRVGKVYGVVSGKGGVGKSMVTSQLAVALRREGYRTAILDADITGPSIPKAFGIHDRARSSGAGRSSAAWCSSSGVIPCGTMWIICSWICLPAPATWR